jgi:hypothetical protein
MAMLFSVPTNDGQRLCYHAVVKSIFTGIMVSSKCKTPHPGISIFYKTVKGLARMLLIFDEMKRKKILPDVYYQKSDTGKVDLNIIFHLKNVDYNWVKATFGDVLGPNPPKKIELISTAETELTWKNFNKHFLNPFIKEGKYIIYVSKKDTPYDRLLHTFHMEELKEGWPFHLIPGLDKSN